MALAKHIQVARREGAKAGFDAYMASSAPTARERQEAIRSAGNKKAQFKAYCAIFTDDLGPRTNHAAVEEHSEEKRESMRERLARMLLGGASDDDLVAALVDDGVGVVVEAPAPAKPKTETKVERLQRELREAQEAEKAAKAAPKADKWAPKNPGENCTSGRLWKLNEAGLLSIRTSPGKPLTSGTAHTVLSNLGTGA